MDPLIDNSDQSLNTVGWDDPSEDSTSVIDHNLFALSNSGEVVARVSRSSLVATFVEQRYMTNQDTSTHPNE